MDGWFSLWFLALVHWAKIQLPVKHWPMDWAWSYFPWKHCWETKPSPAGLPPAAAHTRISLLLPLQPCRCSPVTAPVSSVWSPAAPPWPLHLSTGYCLRGAAQPPSSSQPPMIVALRSPFHWRWTIPLSLPMGVPTRSCSWAGGELFKLVFPAPTTALDV